MIEGTPKSHIFDRRALRRVVAATSVTALVLAGCDKRPKITEGDVYKKVHNDLAGATLPAGKGQLVSYLSLEQDIEAVLSKPIHKEMGFKMEDLKKLGLSVWNSQYGEISVAQCPTPEPRTPETIERECKTAMFVVPQDVYKDIKLGQHFRQPK